MNFEMIMQYATYLLMFLGVLAFVVSVVVQVIKELPGLDLLPTSAVALAVSMILCPIAVLILCTYMQQLITWYYVFASFIAAFIVYIISTGGWEKLKGIWDRTQYKGNGLADRK